MTTEPHALTARERYGNPATGLVVPIYDPGLSAEVIEGAHKVAGAMLADYPELRNDTPKLYWLVRIALGRRPVCDIDRPTLDDESVSQGIIDALNTKEN